MIGSFMASWGLFQNTYLTGWLIAGLLALVGVVVVARDQIFIGAAMSQASALGISFALLLGSRLAAGGFEWFESAHFKSIMAVVFSVVAAMFTARGGPEKRESHEAVTGWIFLAAGSLSILIVAHSPHGLEEIHSLLSSSIIGSTGGDVLTFGILFLFTTAALVVLRQRIFVYAMDPAMFKALGMNISLWDTLVSAFLGLSVGLSIRVSGMLYTFGLLVLPALFAKNTCRELRTMFVVAPLTAVLTSLFGFIIANDYDFPPAQVTVALLCVLLTFAWLFRRIRYTRAIC